MLRKSHGLKRGVPLAAVAALLCALPATASAAVVTNGGFETGNFTGWTVQDEPGSAGSWFVYKGTKAPLSGNTIPAPPQGTFAAITDQTFPSSSFLSQNVTLAAGERHVLSAYVYYHSYAPIENPASLDYVGLAGGGPGGPGGAPPNQQYRIDVMKPSAAINSVASSDILLNVFATKTGDSETMAPTVLTADLTPFAGQTVRLRFAMADNESFLNAGTDAVAVISTPIAVTGKATNVTLYRAAIHGTVNPNGGATTYYFEYGKTRKYGTKTTSFPAGSDSTVHAELARLRGLTPGTKYHFRIVASNLAATSHGADRTFSTPALIRVSGLSASKCTPPTRTVRISVTSGDATKNTSAFIGSRKVGSASSNKLNVSLAGVSAGGHTLRVTTRSAAGTTAATRHFSVCRAAAFTG